MFEHVFFNHATTTEPILFEFRMQMDKGQKLSVSKVTKATQLTCFGGLCVLSNHNLPE